VNQEHEEFRWLCRTCVPANYMDIAGAFVEALAGPQGDLVSAFHLHLDRTFQHVNKNLRIVTVDRARKPRREVHGVHQNFLAGNFCQSMRHQRLDSLLPHEGPNAEQAAGDEECQHQHRFEAHATTSVQIRLQDTHSLASVPGRFEVIESGFQRVYLLATNPRRFVDLAKGP